MLKAVIVGSGNIGTDILIKLQQSSIVKCSYFVGRNSNSKGLELAKSMGIEIFSNGLQDFLGSSTDFDVVFDATSAVAHVEHYNILKKYNKKIINLTPAKLGKFCVPVINLKNMFFEPDINMVTCGGQASIPIAYALKKSGAEIEYLEVVSSISSKSAGPATRLNLNEYLETTEAALREFSGCNNVKTILNINPANPPVNMKTTLLAKLKNYDLAKIEYEVSHMVSLVQKYVPGYSLIVPPTIDGERLIVMTQTQGAGHFLPKYAGNLDIITSAAVSVAEHFKDYEGN